MSQTLPDVTLLAQDLAQATRMLVREGVMDFSGHLSARVAGTDLIAIQDGRAGRPDLQAKDILIVAPDGAIVQGARDAQPPLELALHLGIYAARPDVAAVFHAHMVEAVAMTLLRDVVPMVLRPGATRWRSGLPQLNYAGSISTPERAAELAAVLAHHNGALLRGHGVVLCAESPKALFMDAMFFRENLQANQLVLQSGREILPLSDAELDLISVPRGFNIEKLWTHFQARQA